MTSLLHKHSAATIRANNNETNLHIQEQTCIKLITPIAFLVSGLIENANQGPFLREQQLGELTGTKTPKPRKVSVVLCTSTTSIL